MQKQAALFISNAFPEMFFGEEHLPFVMTSDHLRSVLMGPAGWNQTRATAPFYLFLFNSFSRNTGLCLEPRHSDWLFSHSFLFPNTSTHTSNDNTSHSHGLRLRKQRLPVFPALLLRDFWYGHSALAWPSRPFLLHTLEMLHNLLSCQNLDPFYSFLAEHILIWAFRSANIDKATEIESTRLSITTFPTLSVPLISAPF